MSLSVVPTTESVPTATLTSSCRRISGDTVNGLTWTVFRDGDDFFFTVKRNGGRLHTGPLEHSTAPKAERAAKAWAEDPANSSAAVSEEEAWLADTVARAPDTVNGWCILVDDDVGGAYKAEVFDAESGEIAQPEDPNAFRGFAERAFAVDAAKAWAEEHPSSSSTLVLEVNAETVADLGAGTGEPSPATDTPVTEAAALPRDAELEQLRAELADATAAIALARRERDAVIARVAEDIGAARAEAEECLMLAGRRLQILDQMDTLKDELKFVDTRLRTGTVAAMTAVTMIGQGQQRLSFAASPETRAAVGAAAAKAAQSIVIASSTGGALSNTWPFNGVTHEIQHESHLGPDGETRWTTWLKDHRSNTEGHAFTLDGAVEVTKAAASIVFADADPGSTSSSVDTGPVADGARMPAKRKPHTLKGHDQAAVIAHDQAAVIAAVERHLTLPEAAMDLGCTPQQLTAFAAKAGVVLSKHQGRTAGDELPAAPQEKAGKPRTRKAKVVR